MLRESANLNGFSCTTTCEDAPLSTSRDKLFDTYTKSQKLSHFHTYDVNIKVLLGNLVLMWNKLYWTRDDFAAILGRYTDCFIVTGA